jgi:hypothetical protein
MKTRPASLGPFNIQTNPVAIRRRVKLNKNKLTMVFLPLSPHE